MGYVRFALLIVVTWLFLHVMPLAVNPLHAKLSYLNFHPLEAVSRYRDPQLQVDDNYAYICSI